MNQELHQPSKRLAEILRCARHIREFTDSVGADAFSLDLMRRTAVQGRIMRMAGAVARVPEEYRNANPGVPWERISSFGEKLLRSSRTVDPAEVLAFCRTVVPETVEAITGMFLLRS